jgi:hypothetical protein
MAKIAVALFMMMALCGVCFGPGYNVGESDGWTIGVDYNQWASTKKFQVGDTLGMHRTRLYIIYLKKNIQFTSRIIKSM